MQYRDLIPLEEYKEYLYAHEDLDGILEVHRWLSVRYSIVYPYRKCELNWYFLFLIGSPLPKHYALDMRDKIGDYPRILFGNIENKVDGKY